MQCIRYDAHARLDVYVCFHVEEGHAEIKTPMRSHVPRNPLMIQFELTLSLICQWEETHPAATRGNWKRAAREEEKATERMVQCLNTEEDYTVEPNKAP